MSRKDRQIQVEKTWATLFLELINEEKGYDYEAESELNQDCIIDVYAKSRTTKHTTLNLQLTEAKEWESGSLSLTVPQKKFLSDVGSFNNDCVQKTIDEKIKKYISRGEDLSNVILIVQGYLSKDWLSHEINGLVKQNRHNPFKGIYYLHPPAISNRGTQNGFYFPIKDCLN